MQEREIKLRGPIYKDVVKQFFNLLFLSALIVIMTNIHTPPWIITPIVIAAIVVAVILHITYKSSVDEEKKLGHVKLKCYRWDSYLIGTKLPRIYSDENVYVELFCENMNAYEKFKRVYNSEKKIKKLVYRTFYFFITII